MPYIYSEAYPRAIDITREFKCFDSDERSLMRVVVAHNWHFAQSQVPGEGVVYPGRGAGGGGGTGGRPMKWMEKGVPGARCWWRRRNGRAPNDWRMMRPVREVLVAAGRDGTQ